MTDRLPDGPPCLNTVLAHGETTGAERREVLLNAALYFVKRGSSDLLGEITKLNNFAPPLPASELSDIIETVKRWGGTYRCGQMPLAGCCQRADCKLREFGIGDGPSADGVPLVLGQLVKFVEDETTWIWSINGSDIRFTAKELTDQKRFLAKVRKMLGVGVKPVLPEVWASILARSVVSATHVVAGDTQKTMKENDLWDHFLSFGALAVRQDVGAFL